MAEDDSLDEKEISLFAIAAAVVAYRWRIARWAVAGALLAAAWAFTRPTLFAATSSFVSQGNDPSRSGLASLAGQFGVSLPTGGGQSTSPDLYVKLLKSPVLLRGIARDTVTVRELGGQRQAISDLLDIPASNPARREEVTVRRLGTMVTATSVKSTGVVELTVATPWPSVSLAITTALVDRVNEFNQHTRQSQASAERKFVESRLELAAGDLRVAEDRLENFLRGNREFGSSPQLTFSHDRIQREVLLKQQVYTALMQSLEEVRIREVRDTPVITVLEPPTASVIPQPQRRQLRIALGLVGGAFLGLLVTLLSDAFARRRREGDDDIKAFVASMVDAKSDVLSRVRGFRAPSRETGPPLS